MTVLKYDVIKNVTWTILLKFCYTMKMSSTRCATKGVNKKTSETRVSAFLFLFFSVTYKKKYF